MNQRMKEKINNMECFDVSICERTADGDYILEHFVPDVDYCDLKTEEWIWSIGRNKLSGQIIASTSTHYYENPDYECLWLR